MVLEHIGSCAGQGRAHSVREHARPPGAVGEADSTKKLGTDSIRNHSYLSAYKRISANERRNSSTNAACETLPIGIRDLPLVVIPDNQLATVGAKRARIPTSTFYLQPPPTRLG